MKEEEDYSQGHRLLSAVERIIDSPENIVTLVRGHRRRAGATAPVLTDEQRQTVAESLITHFSNRTAISGGAAALPAMLPGLGTAATLTAGSLADMGLMLKFEVELALSLVQLYGYDVTQEKERQFGLLLASVSTYDVKSGRNFFIDVAEAEGMAIWNYAPREVTKLVVQVLTKMALLNLSKGLLRAVPLVGIAIGASINKALTQRVGARCCEALEKRRATGEPAPERADDRVVDARFPK